MQTSPSPQKESFFIFWYKMRRNVLIRIKNQFSYFYFGDIIVQKSKICIHLTKKPKRCAIFWNRFLSSWVFFVPCLVFEIWSILYYTFVMHSGLRRIQIFVILGGFTSPPPLFCGGFAPNTRHRGCTPASRMLLD